MRSLGELIIDAAEGFRPPERLTVDQSAEKYVWINNPGAYVGPWKNETAPYLVEPQQVLTSREYEAGVFVAPAQSGKTQLSLNWLAHSVICDPMDMMLVHMTKGTARDFSHRRIDRMHRDTAEVGKRLAAGSSNDNTFDKHYRNGMMFTLSWPAISELSGKPIPRLFLTDYDRMPMNVDGEGSPFDLARKRATTFRTAGMTFAESSPGFAVSDLKWIRSTPHEAPPCEGILALYNRGDRRRWYWQCPHCDEWFEPGFELLDIPPSKDIMEAAEGTTLPCRKCGGIMTPEMKYELNLNGRWVRDGQLLLPDGTLSGKPRRSDIASFWLKGPAASFSTWKDLVARYLMAEEEFERTGSQEALKSVVNTDHGEPYYPRGSERERFPDELKEQAKELPEKEVPESVRFLLATADTQKNKWVVQVWGVGPGDPFHLTVIDRFDVTKSNRLDDDGERLWVKPHAILEDWTRLEEEILAKEYPLADEKGHMGITFFGVDSGGKKGVTTKAYDWYRKLRKIGDGSHQRVMLIKGDSTVGAPRARITYPDAQRKDRNAAARGEIPVLMLNPNILKDMLNNMIERAETDGGSISWPDWLPDWWFSEMCSERRTPKGWENPSGSRNEAWDLAYYAIGICIHKKVDRLNWDAPPSWAAEWANNPRVRLGDKTVADGKKGQYSLGRLGATLA